MVRMRGVALLLGCLALSVAGSSWAVASARQTAIEGSTTIAVVDLDLQARLTRLTVASLTIPPGARTHAGVARGPLFVVTTRGAVRLEGDQPLVAWNGDTPREEQTVDLPVGARALIPAGITFAIVNLAADSADLILVAFAPVTTPAGEPANAVSSMIDLS